MLLCVCVVCERRETVEEAAYPDGGILSAWRETRRASIEGESLFEPYLIDSFVRCPTFTHTHTHRLFITNPSDTLALSVFYVFLKKHSRLTISKFREKEALQIGECDQENQRDKTKETRGDSWKLIFSCSSPRVRLTWLESKSDPIWKRKAKEKKMNARGDARGRGDNAARPSCYLCETPKMPWSVIDSLPNLPEGNVVCRSCVNFEGVDRFVFKLFVNSVSLCQVKH